MSAIKLNTSSQLVSLHLRIDTSMKSIMKDGKIDQYDIPEIVLLITDLMSSTGSVKYSSKEFADYLNEMFNYIMTHYNLFPEDEAQKAQFKSMFDMCVKLTLFPPNLLKIKEVGKSVFSCCK